MSVQALFKTSSEADEDAFSSKVLQSVLASTYDIEDIMESGVKRPIEDIDTDIEQAKKRLLVLEGERWKATNEADKEKEQPDDNNVRIIFHNIALVKRFAQIAQYYAGSLLLSFDSGGMSSELGVYNMHERDWTDPSNEQMVFLLKYPSGHAQYYAIDKSKDVYVNADKFSKVLGKITADGLDVTLSFGEIEGSAELHYFKFNKETRQNVRVNTTLEIHEETHPRFKGNVQYRNKAQLRGIDLKKAYSLVDPLSKTVRVFISFHKELMLNDTIVEKAQIYTEKNVRIVIDNSYMITIMDFINDSDRVIISGDSANTPLKIVIRSTGESWNTPKIEVFIPPMIEE